MVSYILQRGSVSRKPSCVVAGFPCVEDKDGRVVINMKRSTRGQLFHVLRVLGGSLAVYSSVLNTIICMIVFAFSPGLYAGWGQEPFLSCSLLYPHCLGLYPKHSGCSKTSHWMNEESASGSSRKKCWKWSDKEGEMPFFPLIGHPISVWEGHPQFTYSWFLSFITGFYVLELFFLFSTCSWNDMAICFYCNIVFRICFPNFVLIHNS